jgi:hypothetical protein
VGEELRMAAKVYEVSFRRKKSELESRPGWYLSITLALQRLKQEDTSLRLA